MRKVIYFILLSIIVTPIFGFGVQWEFFLAGSYDISSLNNTYNQSFSPEFIGDNCELSEVSNIVNFDGKNSSGLLVGTNFLFNGNFGIQAVVVFHKTKLTGAGNLYSSHLEYTALYPPDYAPTEVASDFSIDLPDTDGQFKQFTAALNLLARFDLGSGINADLSGGLSFFRTKGEASTLGYSYYWLGGHSVLFSEFFQLSFDMEPKTKLGLNIGGALNVRIKNFLSLFAAARYFYCPGINADITLKEILNLRELISPQTLEEITAVMRPGSIKINPSFLSLSCGIKLNF